MQRHITEREVQQGQYGGIRGVLFDLDGVVIVERHDAQRRKVHFRRRFARDFNISHELTDDFFRNAFLECLRGRKDLRTELSKRIPAWRWRGSVDDLIEYWFSREALLDTRVLASIASLRENGIRCYIASNQPAERKTFLLDDVGLRKHFDGHFFSCDVGVLKDSTTFFHSVTRSLDLAPGELLYWDDLPKFVEAARETGIEAFVFRSYPQYRATMARYFPDATRTLPRPHVFRGEEMAVADLVEAVVGRPVLRVRRNPQITINRVYHVTTDSGSSYVVKLHEDRARVGLFERAADASRRVRAHGVPAPAVHHVGNTLIPYAYCILEELPGRPLSKAGGSTWSSWYEVGRIAKVMHSVEAPHFGTVYYWQGLAPHHATWKAYFSMETRRLLDEVLPAMNISFLNDRREELRAIFEEASEWSGAPKVIHGNIDAKNILVDDSRHVTGIVDWDNAIYSLPEHEFALLLPWVSESERDAFFDGYGLGDGRWMELLPRLRILMIHQFIDHMKWHWDSNNLRMVAYLCRRIEEELEHVRPQIHSLRAKT